MSKNPTIEKRYYCVNINAPIETVWSELVKTDEVLPFFFGAVCDRPDSTEGATFAMRSKNGKWTNVVGEVLEFSPPNRYSHTLKFTAYDDPPCKITYELEEIGNGVKFSLIAEIPLIGSKTEKSMEQGGNFIVNNFKSVVETGKASLSGRAILMMIRLSEPFSPNKCLSKHWPLTVNAKTELQKEA